MANGDGQFRARIGDESADITTTSSPDGDSGWHMIVVTRTSAGAITLYVDGAQERTGTSTVAVGSSHTLYIGRSFQPDSFTEYFDGAIDDVRVYDTVLSAGDVVRLYAL